MSSWADFQGGKHSFILSRSWDVSQLHQRGAVRWCQSGRWKTAQEQRVSTPTNLTNDNNFLSGYACCNKEMLPSWTLNLVGRNWTNVQFTSKERPFLLPLYSTHRPHYCIFNSICHSPFILNSHLPILKNVPFEYPFPSSNVWKKSPKRTIANTDFLYYLIFPTCYYVQLIKSNACFTPQVH